MKYRPKYKKGDIIKFKCFKHRKDLVYSSKGYYTLEGKITDLYRYYDYGFASETTMYEIDYILYASERNVLSCDEVINSIEDLE